MLYHKNKNENIDCSRAMSHSFLLIFHHPLLLPSSCSFPWRLLLETATWRHLYCVFTYIYSLLIDKYISECRNVAVRFLCVLLVYLCRSSGNLFFFDKSSPPLFCVIHNSLLSLSTWSQYI